MMENNQPMGVIRGLPISLTIFALYELFVKQLYYGWVSGITNAAPGFGQIFVGYAFMLFVVKILTRNRGFGDGMKVMFFAGFLTIYEVFLKPAYYVGISNVKSRPPNTVEQLVPYLVMYLVAHWALFYFAHKMETDLGG